MLPDRAFLARERVLLDRLEMGLADEGYRLFHALPREAGDARAAGEELPGVYSTPLPCALRGLPLTRGLRVSSLLDRVRRAAASEDAPVGLPVAVGERLLDVVHAFGPESWAFAADLARRVGAKLVIEVDSTRVLPRAARAAASAANLGLEVRCLCADEPLLGEMQRGAGRWPRGVRAAPGFWGVHIPAPVRDWSAPRESTSVVMLAGHHDPAAVRSALEGLALAAASVPELMLFVGADLASAMPIFAWCQRLGLEGRLTVLPTIEGQRELVVQADILLIADASGAARTIVLDAMASGMAVIARPDPMVSCLQDGRTARLVGPAATDVSAALTGVIHTPAQAAALAASARQYVQTQRLASGYVRQVLGAYRE
jgi:hypothetical protein